MDVPRTDGRAATAPAHPDTASGTNRQRRVTVVRSDELEEIPIPPEKAGGWQVEADWVRSIRDGAPVRFTDFATGLAYMEFTEAVARSAQLGVAVDLPLEGGGEKPAD